MRGILLLATLTIAVAQAAGNAAAAPASPGSAAAGQPADGAAKTTAKAAAAYQGPTETDIRVAYTQRIDNVNAGSKKFLDPQAAAQLHIRLLKADLIDCRAVDDRPDLYLCNLVVESAVGEAGSEIKRIEAMLAKEGRIWTLR